MAYCIFSWIRDVLSAGVKVGVIILTGDSNLYLADENSEIDSENLDESSNQDYDTTFKFTSAQENIDPRDPDWNQNLYDILIQFAELK